ncbi:alkaline phosphatase D family protein [Chitinimonas koreensis]|uniref:alkaline phosphatase D family protein n=1 Tax=Chitinimonas koreensis TaxID=356302 RepID=UPI00048A4A30|nr:alkaline phosphatase D family protein [Chitinimonas koreensis]QNM98348.1 alkaline phosphatase D family protein [Chitinimonas koreensis]
MDRRHFLKFGSFVTVSAATAGLAGCGGNDGNTNSPMPTTPDAPAATGSNWKFPQSVASGDPRPDSIMLWTRVVPTSADDVATAGTAANLTIKVQVTDADNAAKIGTTGALTGTLAVDAAVPVYAQYDNTVRHKVTGLSAGKTYYYQFVAGDVRSKVGRFKTAPAKDADVAQLKFAFLSCQDWSINHWGAYSTLKDENIDFFVHLGDYIYETVGEAFQVGAVESAHTALTLPNGTLKSAGSDAKYATTLADYRYLYKKYRTDARLQAVHERFAIIAVWDDHEFSDDCWNDAQTYTNGTVSATGGDNEHQPTRRREANQAWYEYMPADIFFSTDPRDSYFNVKIYRELQFGKLAHLVMTDERLYRTDHVIPEAAPNPATGNPVGSIGARYMVPEATLAAVEAQKIAATVGKLPDELIFVSILGQTQRDWWKTTMKGSAATWKLWGNEVSLLKMGVDGTTAIATLLALQAVATLATGIGQAATATGSTPRGAAFVAVKTTGGNDAQATTAVGALATADGMAGGTADQATLAGAMATAGFTDATQIGVTVQAYLAARAAAPAGAATQAVAGAQVIAFGFIKPNVVALKQNSPFIPADKKAGLTPYFTRFVLNADQWDGYNAERKALMKHLKDNSIKNVVALTGDIHAFYAGTVNDDYTAAGGGTPVMVDLVTAGVSSDSFFSYLRDAVGSLSSDLATLVYYPLSIPVTGLGTVDLKVNLLDHTLRASAVTAASLAEGLRVQLRGALGAKGVPEAQLDVTTTAVLTSLQASPSFTGQLVPLAQQLAGMNSNPWLALANTDAQGYALVTLTPAGLSCEFRQVNKLVAGNAPATVVAKVTTATVAKDVAAVTIS